MTCVCMTLCMLASLCAAAPACADQWFRIDGADERGGTVVEVDLDTVRLAAGAGEGVIRVTHATLQPHPGGFDYRSFVATAMFDCHRRTMTLASAAYYPLPAGKGPRLGADSDARQSAMPPQVAQGIPATARHALLKATCGGPGS